MDDFSGLNGVRYQSSPYLLEALKHLVNSYLLLRDETVTAAMIPFGIGEMRFIRPCRPGEEIVLEGRRRFQDSGESCWDIRAIDDAGHIIMTVKGLIMKSFSPEAAMVNGAQHRWTASPQPHGPRWGDAAATRVLSGLGPDGPVIYASDLNSPGVKERLVRRLLAGLPGREPGCAPPPSEVAGKSGENRPGPAAPVLRGQPGPAVSFLPGCRSPLGHPDLHRPGGSGHRSGAEFEEGYPGARAFRSRGT